MKVKLDPRMAAAVADAVHYAISVMGIEGLKATSMFPNSHKQEQAYKKAA